MRRKRRTSEEVRVDLELGSKVCGRCNERLPLISFNTHIGKIDGVSSVCRQCRRRERGAEVTVKQRTRAEVKADVESNSKVCNKCSRRLPFDLFYKNTSTVDGCGNQCKQCTLAVQRQWRNRDRENVRHIKTASKLMLKYGITVEDYNTMLEGQGGACSICKQTPRSKRLSVDHNHSTGEVRGLLCNRCNTMLGFSRDSAFILRAGADYLDGTSSYNKG